jgi:hypothetical protein
MILFLFCLKGAAAFVIFAVILIFLMSMYYMWQLHNTGLTAKDKICQTVEKIVDYCGLSAVILCAIAFIIKLVIGL